jgi:DNA repair exonuclease SbcCD nuclease subunit
MSLKGGKTGMDCSIQLGDMGVGFGDYKNNPLPVFSFNHKWIRGNHDNPSICKKHPNYMGDYGYDEGSGIFFLSGGFSVDHLMREEGLNWWKDEELNSLHLNNAIKLYKEKTPKVVVSHECPTEVKYHVLTNDMKGEIVSNTEAVLQAMLDIHRPNYWIFGHHHNKVEVNIEGTQFVCLDEMISGSVVDCFYEIPELKWDNLPAEKNNTITNKNN